MDIIKFADDIKFRAVELHANGDYRLGNLCMFLSLCFRESDTMMGTQDMKQAFMKAGVKIKSPAWAAIREVNALKK